jgi:hypothetical protein
MTSGYGAGEKSDAQANSVVGHGKWLCERSLCRFEFIRHRIKIALWNAHELSKRTGTRRY